ncbi:MAG TPA: type 2 lanthipeptide synthetase LanM, partial [Vicinamibacterales bacterium]
PVLRAGQGALAASAPLLDRVFAPAARDALARQLLRSAATVAELALLTEFRGYWSADHGGYRDFVSGLLADGLVPLFREYPVLARQLAMLLGRWVASTQELAERIAADRDALAETFGASASGPVVHLEPALSDPHHGGRRVAALGFASGLRVVYKPRSLALDAAFCSLLDWLRDRGLDAAPRSLRLLDRGEYGWVEFVEQEEFASRDQVARYYRHAGALICLTHVLRARDLHMENVVATRGGPVIIDLELMLQPVTRSSATSAPHGSLKTADTGEPDPLSNESCLTTGLLTLVESSAGQAFDVGGLRGTGEGVGTLAGRVWQALDSDAIHYTEERQFSVRVHNAVRLHGDRQLPEQYASDVLSGFEETYRFLVAHREALLAPDGPIAAFAGAPARVLPRPTTQYAALNYLLARPQYQKDGCRWSSAIDALNRAMNQAHDRPEVWPVLVAERKALEGLDIPHFTVQTDETAVRSGSRVLLDGYFVQSGLDAVRDRLVRLDEEDFAQQRERLRHALSETIHSRFATEPQHADGIELDVTSPDFLVDHAVWIARELLARAIRTPRGLTWERPFGAASSGARAYYLYDGLLGPALFLSALSVVTGDSLWRGTAREIVASIEEDLETIALEPGDIGAASGLGSIVYALTIVGALLGETQPLEFAASVARGLTADRITSDSTLDLIGGSAGAALGLLALHKMTRDARLLDLAVCCGDRLCATAQSFDGGTAWRTADGRIFTGFAHGTAGIAYAIGRLFDATGEARFARVASDGYRYVASRFLDGVSNWPILGEPVEGVPVQGNVMTAWCHGAPGIALSISLAGADTIDPRLLDQLEPALKTTAAASPHKADHVCCGNLGRCEALFTTGRRLMRREAFEGARRLARVVIARARVAGHFCLTANGFEYRIFDPGFFRGLSGIGYTLLRLASPSSLPSVAAFEAPPVSRPAGAAGDHPVS